MIFFEAHKRIGWEQPYYVKVLENVSWGLHFHSAYECISVLEGSVECVIGHERNTLTKREAAFIMPEQLHSIETKETSKIQVLVFRQELAEGFSCRIPGESAAERKICMCSAGMGERTRKYISVKSTFIQGMW